MSNSNTVESGQGPLPHQDVSWKIAVITLADNMGLLRYDSEWTESDKMKLHLATQIYNPRAERGYTTQTAYRAYLLHNGERPTKQNNLTQEDIDAYMSFVRRKAQRLRH